MEYDAKLINNYGYLPAPPDENEYVFGGNTKLTGEILMPTGHGWKEFLPPDEFQSRPNLETSNCTVYGTLNVLETLFNRKYGLKYDFSERFIGVKAGTQPQGNDPHKVIETIRKTGLVFEEDLPFDDSIQTWDDYYAPLTIELEPKAYSFKKKWKPGHEWVTPTPEMLMEALKYSPLGIPVRAWQQRNGLYFNTNSATCNHWTALYDFVEGKEWHVFDSYDNTHKHLEWDFAFGRAKKYHVDVNTDSNIFIDIYQSFLKLFQ